MPRKSLVIAAALAFTLSAPGASQDTDEEVIGSNRRTVTCNVDGSYTCANVKCGGQFCCEMPG